MKQEAKTTTEVIEKEWDDPRKCDYCGVTFKPARPQDKDQHFCKPEHRKDFFRYGGAKVKLVAAVRRDFERDYRDFVSATNKKMRDLRYDLKRANAQVVQLREYVANRLREIQA